MVRPSSRWVFVLAALVACNPSGGDGGTMQGPSGIGPEGGLIDFDSGAIPVPWDDATTHPAQGDGAVPSSDSAMPSGDTGTIVVGGGDAHVPTCAGVATDCSLVASCATTRGCSEQGSCGGLSYECFGQIGDFSCISIRGCIWDSTTNSCTGSSWPCNLFNGEASCVGQLGCHWSTTCGGSATPCSLIPAALCTTQPGCFLE
jgi:hypothetical protein